MSDGSDRPPDGHSTDGHSTDGYSTDGHSTDGHSTDGLFPGDGDRTVPALVLFALAQVVVTATLPAAQPTTIVVEALLIGVVLVPFARGPAPPRSVAAFLVALGGLGGLAWVTVAITDS